MQTSSSVQTRPRPPIDLVAEGMWKIACGERCQDEWGTLSKQQEAWWRSCATECVKRWMADAADTS
jgi:hypothetical protein